MRICIKARGTFWLLCPFISGAMGFASTFAESRVIDLGNPEEEAPIAHIYEVGNYVYDPQASTECLGTWSHAADLDPGYTNLSNFTNHAEKTPTGDLDGDGFDDLVIAGFFHSTVGRNFDEYTPMKWFKRSGIWLVFGGANFGAHDQYLDRDLGNNQNSLISYSGSYLTSEDQMSRPFYMWGYHGIDCADMNNDGIDDIVILALGSRPNPDPNVTDATVPTFVWNLIIVYGGSEIRNRFIDLDNPSDCEDITIIELPRQQLDAIEYSRFLRRSRLAIGDFNADGSQDIAVGKHWCEFPADNSMHSSLRRGAVTLLFGGSFPKGEVASISDSRFASRVSEIYGILPESEFGRRLGVGDVNGDGTDDLLVCYVDERYEDPFVLREGSLAVIYGNTALQAKNGLLLELDLPIAPTRIIGISPQPLPEDFEDRIAADIATGDENKDGFDDILVGHWYDYSNDYDGMTVTLRGSATLPGTTMYLRESPGSDGEVYAHGVMTWIQDPVSDSPVSAYDIAGHSVSFADVSGDGIDDWLIWAKQQVLFHESQSWRFGFGRCYILKSPVIAAVSEIDLFNTADIRVETGVYPGCEPYPFYFPAKWTDFPFTGGDLNRDGFAEYGNCSQFGRAPDRLDLTQADIWGSFKIVMGQSTPGLSIAQAVERFKSGNAPARGFGGRTSPVLRAHLSFADGDGPSPVTATLTRNNAGISSMGVTRIGNMHWKFDSPRTGWTEATIRLQYTDSEIDGLREETSKLFHAQSLSGPWTEVANQSQNMVSNEFTATVPSLGYFAIGDVRDFSPLRLLSPNGGEEFSRGSNVTVSWSSTSTVGNKIRIELWRRGALVTVLKAKAMNDGAETVTLPAALVAKNGYVIKIYDAKNRSVADSSDKPFGVLKKS